MFSACSQQLVLFIFYINLYSKVVDFPANIPFVYFPQHVSSGLSAGLASVTDGRIGGLGRVQVVLPRAMAQLCHLTHLPQATWQRWATADIRVQPGEKLRG